MNLLRPLLFFSALAVTSCTHNRAPVLSPDAPLGRVVVYRNGVAYFEREARVDGELTLSVPRGRVDDFLKSLTVVDTSTQRPIAISYATPRETAGAYVEMKIELPPGPRDVRVTYVTESPAWKPSYRVVLGADNQASLQSWAVVDNVSGEAWDKVQVGVGSTSALSFRYDLHSVRMVQRQTIDHGNQLAQAPPTGGSAYAVAGKDARVLANVSMDELQNVPAASQSAGISLQGGSITSGSVIASEEVLREVRGTSPVKVTSKFAKSRRRVGGEKTKNADAEAGPVPPSALDRLAAQLVSNGQRIQIQGNGLSSDGEDNAANLRRANTMREALVARGVATERIEVVEGGVVDDPNLAVQIVAIDEEKEREPTQAEAGGDGPKGSAHFVANDPITLESGHSAMVTLLDSPTVAERVYLYDPSSDRGSKRFAFNAIRLKNPSEHTLDPGPVTVYAEGQFLGEGIAEPIPPKATALVPYALDRTLRVKPRIEHRERVQKLLSIERGIATAQTQRIRDTVLDIDNRGQDAAVVYVRHGVQSGWSLIDAPRDLEQYGDDVLIPVSIAAGERAKVEIAEAMPITSSIDLRSSTGLRSIAVYLEGSDVPQTLQQPLSDLLAAHRRLRDLDDTLATRTEQLHVLRERVQELNVQLVTLRKVDKAQGLSSHLAQRMEEVSEKLDAATIAVTELQAEQLTARIELSNLVADLSLRPSLDGSGSRPNAAP